MKRRRFLISLIVLLFLPFARPYLAPLPAQPDLAAEEVAPAAGRLITVDGYQTYVEEAGPAGRQSAWFTAWAARPSPGV